MMLSIFMEENHNSALYRNTLPIYILKSLILVLMFNFFEVNMLLYLLNATIARHFLLFMSVSVSSIEPRYLHFFHSSSPCLLMLYCSVLLKLMSKFLFLRHSGIVIFICSIFFLEVDIHPMSSAYCWSIQNVLSTY